MPARYYKTRKTARGSAKTARGSAPSTPQEYGGTIGSAVAPQQGVYYSSTGEHLGPSGATGALPSGTTPSQMEGSVTPYGGVVNPATGQPSQTASKQAEREAALSKPTATQKLGEKPKSIGYQTVGGRTQTRVSATIVKPVVGLSEGFARRASEEGVSVSKPTTPFITQQGRTTRPTSILTYPKNEERPTQIVEAEKPVGVFVPSKKFFEKYTGVVKEEAAKSEAEYQKAKKEVSLEYLGFAPRKSVSPTTPRLEEPFFYETVKTTTELPEGGFLTTTTYKSPTVEKVTPLTKLQDWMASLQPKGIAASSKEMGGMIASVKPTQAEYEELAQQYGTRKVTRLWESKVLSPPIEKFFGVTDDQLAIAKVEREQGVEVWTKRKAEGEKWGLNPAIFENPLVNIEKAGDQLSLKGVSPEAVADYKERARGVFEGEEKLKVGFVKDFLAKPVTEVAPALLLGGMFSVGENAAFQILTDAKFAKPLFEALTTPTGHKVVSLAKGALVTTWVGSEALNVAMSEDPYRTAGGSIGSMGTTILGAYGGSKFMDLQAIRRSFWGSSIRRYEEVSGIKAITPESKLKAFETARIEGRLLTPEEKIKLGSEKSVEQIQKELREASDIVAEMRNKFLPENKPITVEELMKVESIKTRAKAKRVMKVLEQSEVIYGGGISGALYGVEKGEGVSTSDIDPYALNSKAFARTVKKGKVEGVFDPHPVSAMGETGTAQLEGFRTNVLKPSGKKVLQTGFMEQWSRKIEGGIRFFNALEEGAVGRGKDLPYVAKMKERYLFGEELPASMKPKLEKPSFKAVVVTPAKIGKLADTARWGTAKDAVKEGERLAEELKLNRAKMVSEEQARMRWAEQEKIRWDWKPPAEKGKGKGKPIEWKGAKETYPSAKGKGVTVISKPRVSVLSGKPSGKPYSYPSIPPSPSIVSGPSDSIVPSPSSGGGSSGGSGGGSSGKGSSYSYKSSRYSSGYGSSYSGGSSYSSYSSSVTMPPDVPSLSFGGGGGGKGWGKAKKLKKRYAPSLYGSTFAVVQKKSRKSLFSGFEVRGLTAKQASKIWKF